jgi:hypothetical protein
MLDSEVTRQRLRDLADEIERTSEPFNMEHWSTCLAAHCLRLFGLPEDVPCDPDYLDNYAVAAATLGLDVRQRRLLMVPTKPELHFGSDDSVSKISRRWAARTLRDTAETGRVSWTRNRETEHAD